MKIGIDFDGVMNDMIVTWVEWLNRDHKGYNVSPQDIVDWEMSKQYPALTREELYAPLNSPEFWDEVHIKPEAPEVIERLLAAGHEIYVVTSSQYNILSFKFDKCLFAHFPYLTKKNVIITYNKSLINVDLLLDDGVHNFKDFSGIKVVFDAPYNQKFEADYRVASWKEFYLLITQLTSKAIRPPRTRVHQFKAGRGMGKTAWLQEQIYNAEVPCYVIMPEQRYRHFCESYIERYHRLCPAKLYKVTDKPTPAAPARFFVDMPSTFPIASETFKLFKDIFVSRNYLIYVADFENTYWHAV